MLPHHDTHLSPLFLATQMDNCQCTVEQIRQIQPILSWPNWEMDAPLTALELYTPFPWVPHKLLATTLTMKKQSHSRQSICGGVPSHSGVGDMVDPGWLSGRLWMDIFSVILGQPREAGALWGSLFHFFSPQLLTRIKGVPSTDCSQSLGWAVSELPPWTFSRGLQKDTALAEVISAAHIFYIPCHDPTGSRIVPAVS